jgi:hypothetical protein
MAGPAEWASADGIKLVSAILDPAEGAAAN